MTRRRILLAALVATIAPAAAHEIESNRATLVLRDGRHLALTLRLDLVSVLHRTLAPARPLDEFAAVHAALPDPQLQAALQQAWRQLQAGVQLVDADGRSAPLTAWRLPDVAQARALLQRQTLHALTGGGHDHGGSVELRAEWLAPKPVGTVHLRLPEALQPALVVWYRPAQGWLRAGQPPLRVDFR